MGDLEIHRINYKNKRAAPLYLNKNHKLRDNLHLFSSPTWHDEDGYMPGGHNRLRRGPLAPHLHSFITEDKSRDCFVLGVFSLLILILIGMVPPLSTQLNDTDNVLTSIHLSAIELQSSQ